MRTRSLLIGSYELKKVYQKNMVLGFGISAAVHVLVIGLVVLFGALAARKPVDAPSVVRKDKTIFIAPPSISQEREQIRVAVPEREIRRPSVGVPTPVPDEEAPEEVELATQQELAEMAPVAPLEEELDAMQIDPDAIIEELLPSPDEFVPYEIMAEEVREVDPIYPPLAQRAGIEGKVWLKVLIDREGNVRDVIIVKDSGANAGFEEAAIEAAKQTVWKPAISNGQPIALWVTYAVHFKLK